MIVSPNEHAIRKALPEAIRDGGLWGSEFVVLLLATVDEERVRSGKLREALNMLLNAPEVAQCSSHAENDACDWCESCMAHLESLNVRFDIRHRARELIAEAAP